MRKLCAVLLFPTAALAADPVPYPASYRNWTHVKSMVIEKGHPLYEAFGGIHRLYANKRALEGYRTGKFPAGAVIVFDLLETKSADNAVQEGARKVLGVMHRDPKKWTGTSSLAATGVRRVKSGSDPDFSVAEDLA